MEVLASIKLIAIHVFAQLVIQEADVNQHLIYAQHLALNAVIMVYVQAHLMELYTACVSIDSSQLYF